MNQDKTAPGTPKEQLNAIRLLVGALVLGLTAFTGLFVFLATQMEAPFAGKGEDIKIIFLLLAVCIAGICLYTGSKLYRKRLEDVKNSSLLLQDKLNQYRAALIIYEALCEGPALLSIVLFFLTGNYMLLLVTAVMAWAMLSKMPNAVSLVTALNLDSSEANELV